MGRAIQHTGRMLMLRNRVFSLRHVQIWAVSSCKGVDLLMLWNSVFSLWNVQVWGLPSCKGVDFLLPMKRCETFIYVQYRFKKGVNLLILRYGFFQTAKRKIRAVPSCKGVDLLMFRNHIFRLRNVQKWLCLPARGRIVEVQESHFQTAERLDMVCSALQRESICWWLGRAFSCCESFRYGLCRTTTMSIFCLSGMAILGCETSSYEQCHPAIVSIYWSSEITFVGCETFRNWQLRSVRISIFWCLGIALSGLETFIYG